MKKLAFLTFILCSIVLVACSPSNEEEAYSLVVENTNLIVGIGQSPNTETLVTSGIITVANGVDHTIYTYRH